MPKIWIDADACPVKKEVYRVASRHRLDVIVVANSWMRTPDDPRISFQKVDGGMDAADDYIAEHVEPADVVITTDVPLADRCVKAGAHVLTPTGRRFTEDNVGDALATRDLMTDLRDAGQITGGPPPMGKRERSRFLERLEEVIRLAVRREETRRT